MKRLNTLKDRLGGFVGRPTRESGAPTESSSRRWFSLRWLSQGKAGELFGADLRSLAVFRIVLACVVLMDLASRATNLRAHYTDQGVLPRGDVLRYLDSWRWSLNMINGTLTFQAFLFGLAALACVTLLLGYRTRPMTIVIWVLLVSIQARNPLVNNAGDNFLRLLLLWSILLPLGACWSLDSKAKASRLQSLSTRFLSFATLGLFLQIAFMYWFTVALKSNRAWHEDGTALYFALGARQVTRPLGEYLHQFPDLLGILTWATIRLEIIAPVLLFCPIFTGPVRTLAAVSIMSLHFGIALTMDIGVFPWTSALCMVCVLPEWFWDTALPKVRAVLLSWTSITHRIGGAVSRPTRAYWPFPRTGLAMWGAMRYSSTPGFESAAPVEGGTMRPNFLQAAPQSPLKPDRIAVLGASALTNVLAAICLLFVFAWNMSTIGKFTLPQPALPVSSVFGLYQRWDMFAPRPPGATSWHVVVGVLQDGRLVDLMNPILRNDLDQIADVSWEEPDNIASKVYKDEYWRKYWERLATPGTTPQTETFAGYACRGWNGHHDVETELASLDIYLLSKSTLPNAQSGPVQLTLLGTHRCL